MLNILKRNVVVIFSDRPLKTGAWPIQNGTIKPKKGVYALFLDRVSSRRIPENVELDLNSSGRNLNCLVSTKDYKGRIEFLSPNIECNVHFSHWTRHDKLIILFYWKLQNLNTWTHRHFNTGKLQIWKLQNSWTP